MESFSVNVSLSRHLHTLTYTDFSTCMYSTVLTVETNCIVNEKDIISRNMASKRNTEVNLNLIILQDFYLHMLLSYYCLLSLEKKKPFESQRKYSGGKLPLAQMFLY